VLSIAVTLLGTIAHAAKVKRHAQIRALPLGHLFQPCQRPLDNPVAILVVRVPAAAHRCV
jgi:hypothetical protein